MTHRSSSVGSNYNIPYKERRRSFLDIGGPNSISNFASSYKRAQSYVGLLLIDNQQIQGSQDDISPCTSINENSALVFAPEESIENVEGRREREHDHFESFNFQHHETSPLISRRTSKADSERMITGDSTAPQTIFNCINTLMGIGMLALPFGFHLSGWVFGSAMLLFSSIITSITAKMLGKILKKHPHLTSYGDIAHLYGGSLISFMVTAVFSLDLLGAIISLIILFSDSFNILFPSVHKNVLKGIIVTTTLILSFLPLSILSMFSLLGIICTSGLILLIILCGLITSSTPGSLLAPAVTNLWPGDYKLLLVSLGIFMAPWGGHPVFPELYKDMRHPLKFSKCCSIAFGITFSLDYSIAFVGFLMFGLNCEDSLAKNLMTNKTYPLWVKPLICLFMGMLPISKLPLIARPIISVYESSLSLNDNNYIVIKNGRRQEIYNTKRVLVRILFYFALLLVSLLFNSFGKVISFLGSAICFTICMTLPLMFYLKFYKDEISLLERVLIKTGILVGSICSIVGTYGSIAIDV